VSRIVKRWIWRDKAGKAHDCVELEDGSRYVIEKRGRKRVMRPLEKNEDRKHS